jgi:hypothetical protein
MTYVLNQQVSIYRCSTPESGQGSSAFAEHMSATVKGQKRLLNLPRARSAPPQPRRAVRRNLKSEL